MFPSHCTIFSIDGVYCIMPQAVILLKEGAVCDLHAQGSFLTLSLSLICSPLLKSGSPCTDSRPPMITDPLSLGCKAVGVTNMVASLCQHKTPFNHIDLKLYKMINNVEMSSSYWHTKTRILLNSYK